MNKTTRLLLQLLLVLLVVATYLVFRFPYQTQQVMRPLFRATSLHQQLIDTQTTQEFRLSDYVTKLSSQSATVQYEILTNLPITVASGSTIDITVSLSGSTQLNNQLEQEFGSYGLALTTPQFTYTTNIESAYDQGTNSLRLLDQSFALADNTQQPEPLLMLMKGLLEQYDETWIRTDAAIVTFEQWLLHSMQRVRFLDTEKNETFIAGSSDAYGFSGNRQSDTKTFTGTINSTDTLLTGTILTEKQRTYKLAVSIQSYTFSGLAILQNNGYTLQGTITTPQGVSFPLRFSAAVTKPIVTQKPQLPIDSIARSTIIRNLRTLGIFE